MEKANLLILCTGNSARSQMAEAYFEKLAGDKFNVVSAGLEPRPVNPLAIQVMKEDGIDISHKRSKGVKEFLGRMTFQAVIFVCEKAEMNCPTVFPFSLKRFSWPFEDPAAFEGSDEARLEKFRDIRDQIKEKIEASLVSNEI